MLRTLSIIVVALCLLAAGPATAAKRASKITTVTVVMKEYRFNLSRYSMPVGTVVFKIVNKGTSPHNMVFQAPIWKESPLIQAGGRYQFRVRFRKAGRYVFVCTPHFELGMSGRLRVTKA
jgi:plastocyanin